MAVLIEILPLMKIRIYLQNEIICKEGFKGDTLHFIYVGTVAIYGKNGKEIRHIYDGDYFGEMAMITKEKRCATVKAVDTCKVYNISYDDFEKVLVNNPEILEKMKSTAAERLEVQHSN